MGMSLCDSRYGRVSVLKWTCRGCDIWNGHKTANSLLEIINIQRNFFPKSVDLLLKPLYCQTIPLLDLEFFLQ